jgi:protein-S-isoprenylcysteine O-methyltransferase Ste14
MRRDVAAAGSAVFFAIAPGIIAGFGPYAITGWRMAGPWGGLEIAGAAITAIGTAFLIVAFARFVMEGAGTPAPVAPPERLVVGGLYRHVRNPMYLAVLTAILGQALLFRAPGVVAYAAIIALAFAAFVKLYEEPTLLHRYGAQYEAYRRAVPAWLPRLTPARLPGP